MSGAMSVARCARLGALPHRWATPTLCSLKWRSCPAGQVAVWQAEESGGRGRSVSGARWTTRARKGVATAARMQARWARLNREFETKREDATGLLPGATDGDPPDP